MSKVRNGVNDSRIIYLDNNATTQLSPEVVEVMLPFYNEFYGNPSSLHSFGGSLKSELNKTRESIADLLGARLDLEVYFTSGATESNNAAVRGALLAQPDKKHIVISKVEHESLFQLANQLEKEGVEVSRISVDHSGQLNLEELKDSIRPDTAIVSIMYANNETGVIFPIEKIANIVKEKGVLFHTDAVQAMGKLSIDLKNIPIDLLSASSHKIHGPKGVGILYIRRGTRVQPLILGGEQERGRRGGTENVPAIVGLKKAAELAKTYLREGMSYIQELRDHLEQGINSQIPMAQINGRGTERLPNTTNISFEGIEGEAALLVLSELGVCVSSGSACASGKFEPSHVLRAMGIPDHMGHGSIRFSLGRYNLPEEVDFVIRELPSIVQRLRQMTPSSSKA